MLRVVPIVVVHLSDDQAVESFLRFIEPRFQEPQIRIKVYAVMACLYFKTTYYKRVLAAGVHSCDVWENLAIDNDTKEIKLFCGSQDDNRFSYFEDWIPLRVLRPKLYGERSTEYFRFHEVAAIPHTINDYIGWQHLCVSKSVSHTWRTYWRNALQVDGLADPEVS